MSFKRFLIPVTVGLVSFGLIALIAASAKATTDTRLHCVNGGCLFSLCTWQPGVNCQFDPWNPMSCETSFCEGTLNPF